MVKYPEVSVRLVGQDGNAFSIIARVSEALRRHGVKRDVIQEFVKEATKGSYDELLVTVMNWVQTDDSTDEDCGCDENGWLCDEHDDDNENDNDHCDWCDNWYADCECA
jgi:hypothetical protein